MNIDNMRTMYEMLVKKGEINNDLTKFFATYGNYNIMHDYLSNKINFLSPKYFNQFIEILSTENFNQYDKNTLENFNKLMDHIDWQIILSRYLKNIEKHSIDIIKEKFEVLNKINVDQFNQAIEMLKPYTTKARIRQLEYIKNCVYDSQSNENQAALINNFFNDINNLFYRVDNNIHESIDSLRIILQIKKIANIIVNNTKGLNVFMKHLNKNTGFEVFILIIPYLIIKYPDAYRKIQKKLKSRSQNATIDKILNLNKFNSLVCVMKHVYSNMSEKLIGRNEKIYAESQAEYMLMQMIDLIFYIIKEIENWENAENWKWLDQIEFDSSVLTDKDKVKIIERIYKTMLLNSIYDYYRYNYYAANIKDVVMKLSKYNFDIDKTIQSIANQSLIMNPKLSEHLKYVIKYFYFED